MYLSKLEIIGFKSFAQRTTVSFNEGVTSIVGPNGSGKTNIVDAIRWCLGEQKSITLRSDKMENVIFNGTNSKKPMGMAEVSLTIQNNKGILPTEYSEVTITRRIFRSGESEYLLNKNICRLKDITNLFMDTGMGSNAYSVIEFKMIETILSNKADERRTMFEEAAGVNKYKLRRRLALRKLDEVKSDLVRVNDIVDEIGKKVNSLERQAKKADKYNKISSTLRKLELNLSERELALFNLQKQEAKQKKDGNFQKKILIESELSKLENDLKTVKIKLTGIEKELENKRAELSSSTEKIFTVQRNISVKEERKNSLEKNVERFRQELEELNLQLTETEDFIRENDVIINEFNRSVSLKETEKQKNRNTLDNYVVELEEKRNQLKNRSGISLNKFKEITNKENELSNLQNLLESKNNAIAKLNNRIQTLTNNIAKTVGFIEELNQEKSETENKLSEAENIYTLKQKEKEELEKKLNSLKEKELEDKGLINNIKDKIGFIQDLIDNLEGVSNGAKALLENNAWSSGNAFLVAHIGNSKEKFRFAVEISLKNYLNNILVESLDDLKNGIEYLKNNRSGKASFFITTYKTTQKKTLIDQIEQFLLNKKITKLQKENGFIGWATEFIQTENKWKPFFEKMLFQTAIVDSLDNAISLSQKYPKFNFATLDGDYIDNTGNVVGGSEPKLNDSLFGRKQLLEELKNEFPKREEELKKLKNEIGAVEEKINNINLKVLSERGRLLVNDLANVEKQIAQLEFEEKKASDDIEKARSEVHNLAVESNRLDTQINELRTSLEIKKDEKLKIDGKREILENEFNKFELEFNTLMSNQNNLNLEIERLKGEKKNAENAIKRAEESIMMIKKSISKRKYDITSSNEEIDSLRNIIEEKQIEYEQLEQGKAALQKEENDIDLKFNNIRFQITEIENKQNTLRQDRELLSDEIHNFDMSLRELGIKISNLIESIHENYSFNIELKSFDDLDIFDFKGRTDEVHILKQQVKNLGPINLLAYSEFEEEKERLAFLTNQR
ncbi:MAG TPA: chromosome segregation protein SMC, partial [Ignavibacteria bacterium]|nr:chromosome segregation protein SMC [Ignavibacteria bacterium]